MPLADNLQRLRKDKGWKQEHLAEISGVSITQISKIERNDTDPRVSTIEKLSKALSCSTDNLLFDTETSSLNGMLKQGFEKAIKLHPRDKAALMNVINMTCAGGAMIKTMSEYVDEALGTYVPLDHAKDLAAHAMVEQQEREHRIDEWHENIDDMVESEVTGKSIQQIKMDKFN